MRTPAKIAVRLPNWLGDLVMSAGFMHQLKTLYPEAEVDVIVRRDLVGFSALLPGVKRIIPFAKTEWPGIRGAFRFGRNHAHEEWECFFCLPDSLSSACMAFGTGSAQRVGYRKEMRQVLLTHSFRKPDGCHRVEEYAGLLQNFCDRAFPRPVIHLKKPVAFQNETLSSHKPLAVFHHRSAASSRTLPVDRAVEIMRQLSARVKCSIALIGTAEEKQVNDELAARLPGVDVHNLAGELPPTQLAALLCKADLLISVDSGPAHLANAYGTPTIVLFGPGDEHSTAPYNKNHLHILRSGRACSCGVSNNCKYGTPQCMEAFAPSEVVACVEEVLQEHEV